MRSKRIAAALLCCLLLLPTLPARAADSARVRVAFLDSGISTKHLDADRVEAGENFVFPGKDTADRIGHGTAAAGILLGSAELGLAGLCPTATAVPLVCYDAYPTGVSLSGGTQALADAIRAAVDEYGCRLINISMGTTTDDPVLRAAVEYAQAQGALLISAVGNDNLTAPDRVYYPAAYNGVIGVGAADASASASFSQRISVDVLAPGVSLETVTNRNAAESELRSGTSFACAYITGVCAALWTQVPELTAEEVRQALFALARDIGAPGFDADSGWGIVTLEQAGGAQFTDIGGHWARESIEFCVARGLFTGVSSDTFAPDSSLTRAMFAVVLYRLAGEPTVIAAERFSDVESGRWYTDAVLWAADRGIVNGYGGGLFGPDDCVDRQQAAAMLYRYAAGRGLVSEPAQADALSAFADADSVSAYARPAMSWACGAGILNGAAGEGGMVLAPGEPVTRAQLAAMLTRLCAVLPE